MILTIEEISISLLKWCNDNKMKINLNKCHLILSGNKNQLVSHSGHWGINALFLAKPPLNQQTAQASLFRQSSPLYIDFSRPP